MSQAGMSEPAPLERAAALDDEAHALRAEGELDRAAELYEQALRLRLRHLGREHPEIAVSLEHRAAIHRLRGDVDRADALLRRAMRILEEAPGAAESRIADLLFRLARGDLREGRPGDAVAKLERVLELRGLVERPETPAFVEVAEVLSEAYAALPTVDSVSPDHHVSFSVRALERLVDFEAAAGRLERAELLLSRLHGLCRSFSSVVPSAVATECLRRLGHVNRELGELERSERFFRELAEKSGYAFTAEDVGARRHVWQGLVDRRLEAGALEEASELLGRLADSWAETAPSDLHRALACQERRWELLSGRDRLADAEPALRAIVGLCRRMFGEQAPETLQAVERLAHLESTLGKPEAAIPLLESLPVLGDPEGDPTRKADLLQCLADLESRANRPERAEERLGRLLEHLESQEEPDLVWILECLERLATLAEAAGRPRDAESRRRRAFELGLESPSPAEATLRHGRRLAELLLTLQEPEEAEAVIDRMLGLGDRASDPDGPAETSVLDLASVLDLKAGLCRRRSCYFDAESYDRRAIERRRERLGSHHPEVGRALGRLADQLAEEGRFEAAAELYEEGLRILDGREGAEIGVVRLGWAELCFDTGRPEAEGQFQEAIEELEAGFGEDPRRLVAALSGLARLHLAARRPLRAEPLLRRAYHLLEEYPVDPSALAETGSTWAEALFGLGRFEDAAFLLQKTLDQRAADLGEDHLEVAAAQNRLGRAKSGLGESAEAEAHFARAREIYEALPSDSSLKRAATLSGTASVRLAQGRYEEAIWLYREVLRIRERGLDPRHPEVASALCNLAAALRAAGRPREAEPLLARAVKALADAETSEADPDRAARFAAVLDLQAGFWCETDRLDRAERAFHRTLAVREKILGPDHPETGHSLLGLATVEHLRGRSASARTFYRRCFDAWEGSLGDAERLAEARRRYELLGAA